MPTPRTKIRPLRPYNAVSGLDEELPPFYLVRLRNGQWGEVSLSPF